MENRQLDITVLMPRVQVLPKDARILTNTSVLVAGHLDTSRIDFHTCHSSSLIRTSRRNLQFHICDVCTQFYPRHMCFLNRICSKCTTWRGVAKVRTRYGPRNIHFIKVDLFNLLILFRGGGSSPAIHIHMVFP